ncbi:MAG: hypothetical protein QOG53_225 [Frankiales bacterium]|jgi:hypothetical protein|nr:hypothetical protein [Frankiales bacterium]
MRPEPIRERNDYLNHLLDHIAESGVTVQHVIGNHTHPSYSHTVGLAAIRHPELVVTGLEIEDAGALLNALGHDIVMHGVRPQLGLQQLGDWPTFWFMPIYRQRRRLWTAVDLYGPSVTGWQAVWPEEGGLWPWEAADFLQQQPVFGRPPSGRGACFNGRS